MKKNSVIIGMLEEELSRNKKITLRYEMELSDLPKGSIVKRKIGSNEYYYLSRRIGQKVVTEYLGKYGEVKITELEKKIEQRRYVETIIKRLKTEKKEIERMLK